MYSYLNNHNFVPKFFFRCEDLKLPEFEFEAIEKKCPKIGKNPRVRRNMYLVYNNHNFCPETTSFSDAEARCGRLEAVREVKQSKKQVSQDW